MKQIVQNYRTGEIRLVEVPAPSCRASGILVRNVASLVSAGTEKFMLEFARRSLLGKARMRPDLVQQLFSKLHTEGLGETVRQARARLEKPVPLGYSAAGVIIEVGAAAKEFRVGDRVACVGSGFASHAEIISVPSSCAVKIPDEVSFEDAAFAALGGIALEAIRLANVEPGDKVAVIGLGLLGQLTVALLHARRAEVLSIDIDPQKVALALRHGARAGATLHQENVIAIAEGFSEKKGVKDAIIMAATPSNEPLELASEIVGEGGRIVATGLIGLEVPRKLFYEKELELVVSRAWGKGLGHVNAFLNELAAKTTPLDHLITHRFPFEKALEAYKILTGGRGPYFGILLKYDEGKKLETERKTAFAIQKEARHAGQRIGVGVIGAGMFVKGTALPLLRQIPGVEHVGIVSLGGVSAHDVAARFGFRYASADVDALLRDESIKVALIFTPHDTHARFVVEALKARKHVFVEKPLCLSNHELSDIAETYRNAGHGQVLMVGFNRRFSPCAEWLKEKFAHRQEPFAVHITVNAGDAALDSWVRDPKVGGGQLIGEVGHFIDLLQYFTDAFPQEVFVQPLNIADGVPQNASIGITMSDGSVGSILYTTRGDRRYMRERIEMFCGRAVGVIENFRRATYSGGGKTKALRSLGVDRGHANEFAALFEAIRTGGTSPVPFSCYAATTLATFAIEESWKKHAPVSLPLDAFFKDTVFTRKV